MHVGLRGSGDDWLQSGKVKTRIGVDAGWRAKQLSLFIAKCLLR